MGQVVVDKAGNFGIGVQGTVTGDTEGDYGVWHIRFDVSALEIGKKYAVMVHGVAVDSWTILNGCVFGLTSATSAIVVRDMSTAMTYGLSVSDALGFVSYSRDAVQAGTVESGVLDILVRNCKCGIVKDCRAYTYDSFD